MLTATKPAPPPGLGIVWRVMETPSRTKYKTCQRADELLVSQRPSPAANAGANVLTSGQVWFLQLGQHWSPLSRPGKCNGEDTSSGRRKGAGETTRQSDSLRVISSSQIGVRRSATGPLRRWEGSSCPNGHLPPASSQAAPGQFGSDPPRLLLRWGGRSKHGR
ncbi:Phthiocerol/phenolphthiocerol synthesis polyketide synthase type I PpsD [Dissostichus eleginoides]|uniref:Phthiocerol/phenolphthiocerol synthesis polyketide synthase type I PpsD n=1 Tax=Dissostichus eleginoides TaxID=100907 RepID=A0AAD9B6Z8_DISEL|nr:Phthiocerol/phenolphthiocerol synthesis polyketide synthase type I PpsD [Dissostichus eleginoides]